MEEWVGYTTVSVCDGDNCWCKDKSLPGCPYPYNNDYYDYTNTGDSCKVCTIGSCWIPKEYRRCFDVDNVYREVGDSCRATDRSISVNGTMSTTGSCVVNYTPPPSGGGGGCFIAGTPIVMADGSMKNIEEVAFGDFLLGSENANQVKTRYIIDYAGWVYGINGRAPFATETHPFLTTEGWKSFAPLQTMKETAGLTVTLLEKGDAIITDTGTVVLESFNREWMTTKVYNFNVTNTHDFYANGYLVHNVKLLGLLLPMEEDKGGDEEPQLR